MVGVAVLPVIVLFWISTGSAAVFSESQKPMPPPSAAVLPAMVLLRMVKPPAATVPKK